LQEEEEARRANPGHSKFDVMGSDDDGDGDSEVISLDEMRHLDLDVFDLNTFKKWQIRLLVLLYNSLKRKDW